MINTIEEALDLLRSERVQGELAYRYEITIMTGGSYMFSGPDNLTRIASAEEVMEDANSYSMAFQRRALFKDLPVGIARAALLSDGNYYIFWAYRNGKGERKSFPFKPIDAKEALYILQVIRSNGDSIDPLDMIDKLKAIIAQNY